MDYIDYKKIYIYIMVFTFVQIITISHAVKNEYTFMLSVSYIFAVDGSISSMTPVLTLKIFGFQRGPEVYSIMQTATATASLLGIVIVQTCKPYEGYAGIFVIGFFLNVVAIVCYVLIDEKEKFKYTDVYIG